MTIYLIRHGKTLANEQRLYCGSTDLSLSPAGVKALEALHYPKFKAKYITSGMHRTNETLQILFGDTVFEVDPRFREVDFGCFEMKSYAQLKDEPAYQAWLAGDNESNIPPGGESGLQMKQRALEAFGELREDTVLIAHGGVIAAIMQSLFPEEKKSRYEWQPDNGCGYAVYADSYRRIP